MAFTPDGSKFVAGHYTISWNGQDIGTTEQGIMIEPAFNIEEIKVDEWGDAIVDGIYRGYNLQVSFDLSQWGNTNRAAIQFPFDVSTGTNLGTLQGVGATIVGSFAKQLVCAPSPQVNSFAKTYTFPLTCARPGSSGWNLNTRLRRVRVQLLAYPNLTTGQVFYET